MTFAIVLSMTLGMGQAEPSVRLSSPTSAVATTDPGLESPTYGVAKSPWSEKLGNHRARVQVAEKSDAIWVRVPWRRRDDQPERKEIIIIEAATNKRIKNVLAVNVNREFGDILFEGAAQGEYFIYYMPYRYEGSAYSPNTVYLSATDSAAADWAKRQSTLAADIVAGKTTVPRARVLEIQAISEFHRFDPMEVIATVGERGRLLTANRAKPYLVFSEDRLHPIRMTDDLPQRWALSGPRPDFEAEAQRGEYFTFQIGVFASAGALENLCIDFGDLKSTGVERIPAAAMRCFNLGGVDWLGKPFRKNVRVPAGKVQALWIGIQVPKDAMPGLYAGVLTLRPKNAAATPIRLGLTVTDKVLDDAGDGEIWRYSRLRWLDSTIGLDDDVLPPFTPVTLDLKEKTAGILGRQVRFDDQGMLSGIASTFTRNVDGTDSAAREVLAAPMQLVVGATTWKGQAQITQQTSGAVAWQAKSRAEGLSLDCRAKLECDGYINYRLTLRADAACDLKNISLEIPIRREAAVYMMGMGRKGGFRPKEWAWKWDVSRANSQLWIGDVNAGLALKLKHVDDRWDIYNMRQSGPYRDWSNEGKGGCTMSEEEDRVLIRAFTGPRKLAAGEEVHLNFGLLITPVKTLDKEHWSWRYYQNHGSPPSVADAVAHGANIVNIHQGNPLNPHINYPFDTADRLKAYTQQAHAAGLKVKQYYTVRELTVYTGEFWALRSLGNEIFLSGPGFHLADQAGSGQPFMSALPESLESGQEQVANKPAALTKSGSSWLCEHVVNGYSSAWHQPIGPAHYDASIATTGLSRWHNYYLEGLNWLIRNAGSDGLYLDGVGYDREIMKRVRKVMLRARPGCLIDFHSGNNFHPDYGLNNCANQYMELFPYVDSLWFGEGFDYNEPPDYWLVEISGIPFGLFGEMLQGGGNPWRGMAYGMTNRLGWGGNPQPLWKFWDEFGIKDARMAGYWDKTNPVQTKQKDVLATVYVNKGRTLIALASWAKAPVSCQLTINWKSLGLDPEKAHLYAPAIKGLQQAAVFKASDTISIAPGQGRLFIVDEEKHDPPRAQ